MEMKAQKVYYSGNRNIRINVIPGHFATNHSHVNFYVDLTNLKIRHQSAKLAAEVLVGRLGATTPVETIICLEGTEIIGAFMAEALSQSAPMAMNSGININVLTPEVNVNNQMIFQHNTQDMVTGKSILLLLASVSTGKTINRALDCLQYYQGALVGIGALFSAARAIRGTEIHSIFTEGDLPQYVTAVPGECEMCRQKRKIDAIVNSFGYTPI